MTMALELILVLLRQDESSVYRVGASRVDVDVVCEFNRRATPEAVAAYDTLDVGTFTR